MGEILYYYKIIPATSKFRGGDGLTYSSPVKLDAGQIVSVDFRDRGIQGIVVSETDKPEMITKSIAAPEKKIVLPELSLRFLNRMLSYYPSFPGATANLFAASYVLKALKPNKYESSSTKIGEVSTLPTLTEEQSQVYKQISGRNKASTLLLHGETGSGKTRVYIEATKDALKNNQSVLILTPEISLTAPLSKQFKDVFGDAVHINHSSLTPKQRLKIWEAIHYGEKPTVLIGPRSSLFMPFSQLGLIVIDEFHEAAYKQESAPYYNGIRAASILANEAESKLVLGSGTPSVSEYFLAKNKKNTILRMNKQAKTNRPRVFETKIIDLADSNERTSYPLLSKTLIDLVKNELSNQRQSLLFINKRGSARTILCQNCGWRSLCPNCDLPLVYHSDHGLVRCHTCGFSESPTYNCPECGSADIQFKSPGTKTIVEQLRKIFPDANIVRFDKDNKKQDKLENNYEAIKKGEADIIVGTQLLVKGHDLPKLGLAAMLQADSSLNFPDFSSEERSFQMIRQLSGRVGRGHQEGKVVLQTFDPENPLLQKALRGDWEDFYESQINQRKKLGFPPFYHSLKIEAGRKTRKSAEQSMDRLSEKLKNDFPKINILGPSPSFIEKKTGLYNWQIIVKSKNRDNLTGILLGLKGNYKANIDPFDFL